MSTKQHHNNDSSLNNQPEHDANKLVNAGIRNTPTDINVNENDISKPNAPIDKKGDTWAGGNTFVNKQVK